MPCLINSSVASRREKKKKKKERRAPRRFRSISRRPGLRAPSPRPPRRRAAGSVMRNSYLAQTRGHSALSARSSSHVRAARRDGNEMYDRTAQRALPARRRRSRALGQRRRSIADRAAARLRGEQITRRIFGAFFLRARRARGLAVCQTQGIGAARRSSARLARQYRTAWISDPWIAGSTDSRAFPLRGARMNLCNSFTFV